MDTVIVRLAASTDGRLHGVVEVVGDAEVVPFAGDESLLRLLHRVQVRRADTEVASGTERPT